MKTRVIIVGAVLAATLFCGCGKKTELTVCPLKNGDEMVYEESNTTRNIMGREVKSVPFQHVYQIKKHGDGFSVDFIIRTPGADNKNFDNNISDKQGAEIFNQYGQLTGRTKGNIGARIKGNQCKLWLPPAKRKAGATIKFSSAGSSWTVSGPVKWRRWNAWEVSCDAGYSNARLYFDDKTGFLVGSHVNHLIETNLKGLPVDEKE